MRDGYCDHDSEGARAGQYYTCRLNALPQCVADGLGVIRDSGSLRSVQISLKPLDVVRCFCAKHLGLVGDIFGPLGDTISGGAVGVGVGKLAAQFDRARRGGCGLLGSMALLRFNDMHDE
jgi:hypothetical protein